MTEKETSRYFQNHDVSSVRFKQFARSPEDTYPTFSFCIGDDQTSDEKDGRLFSYFNEDIAQILPVAKYYSYSQFAHLLQGKQVVNEHGTIDFRNISQHYTNTFFIELEMLYQGIEFKRENKSKNLYLNADNNRKTRLPFYVSYQDSHTVCITRNEDNEGGIIRTEDVLTLEKEKLQKFHEMVVLKIFSHHPGQLLRNFDTPIFQSTIKDLDWKKPAMTFKTTHVSIVRKRPNGRYPCNIDLIDDDQHFIKKVSEDIGCVPTYFKNILRAKYKLPICESPDALRKAHELLDDFSQIQATYQPPCNELMSTNMFDQQKKAFGKEYLILKFKYMDRNYLEVKNQREFGFESFWSTVGGFIGIFIGTSLIQVPNLIINAIAWLRSLKKQL